MAEPRIGVVGATGAVGKVTLELLAGRGFGQVRAFASERSAGSTLPYGEGELVVEEASADTLGSDLDLCFFSVGTAQSAELVPAAAAGGAVCVDKSSAFRLTEGVPLVVPEVNGDRAAEHEGIVANPNCSTIQLVCALAPLHEAAGLRVPGELFALRSGHAAVVLDVRVGRIAGAAGGDGAWFLCFVVSAAADEAGERE